MTLQDPIDYHSDRAMRELDLGLLAKTMQAARAHLQLSSMHLDKVRELKDGESARSPLSM